MNTASLNEIKKELNTLDPEVVAGLCMRLAKYKKENKELLNYLLFEAHHEPAYITSVKEMIDEFFKDVPAANLYLTKKTLRKILRFVNKQIKYSGIVQTEIELRVYFCTKTREKRVPLTEGTVLFNLYQQQLKKINTCLGKLPEDLQADYQREIEIIA
ncbi:MAG TPA: hypothetical protein VFD46_11645 [Chryseolinea sp.]|nr:hypothetical protein [Chryseolinea sp.]